MFAGHIEDLLGLSALEDLIHGVEFGRLGLMTEVAGVNDELWLFRHAVDSVYSGLER